MNWGLPILHSGSYHHRQLPISKKKNEMAPPLSCTLMQTYAPTNLQIFLSSVCMKHHLLLLLFAKDGLPARCTLSLLQQQKQRLHRLHTTTSYPYMVNTLPTTSTQSLLQQLSSPHITLQFFFIGNFPKGQVYLCMLLNITSSWITLITATFAE